MVEINRIYPEGIFRVKGNYSEFLLKREEFVEVQNKQRESLENTVRREVEWLRRGPKARTTKSKARIDQAGRMMSELADMQARAVTGSTQIDFSASGRKTKKLIHVEGLRKELGGRTLFHKLNLNLAPGVRLGLVGPNGSGKTTLLRMLAGQTRSRTPESSSEPTDSASFTSISIASSSIRRSPLRTALCPHGDNVIFRDRPMHVVSWAKRFLFRTEQLDLAVERLSGGERARVAIARLMLQTGRRADARRADERSRHQYARSARREPAGFRGSARTGNARSLHARPGFDDRARARWQGRLGLVRRLLAMGAVPHGIAAKRSEG